MGVDYSCDWRSGFVMDANKKQRVGYLTSFEGLDLGSDYLKRDIEVFTPYDGETVSYPGIKPEGGKVQCAAVIESFSWGGGVGDPLQFSAYVSLENATLIRAKLQATLKTTKVSKLGWWICNYDEENKLWFEESYPKAPADVSGQLNTSGGHEVRLVVAEEATKVSANIDLDVYNLYFELVPAANATFAFHFAMSAKTSFVRNWGLKVGQNAADALGNQ